MNREWNNFLLAVQFLTRLPVGKWLKFDAADFPASTLYFPLVGAIIGAIAALVYQIAGAEGNSMLAVLLAILAMVLVTGALHEDGIADTADGLGGGATKERAMEIMRDSRIGTYGATALWFVLAIRWAALERLSGFGHVPLWRILIVVPMLSRAGGLNVMQMCDYVRQTSATTKPFATRPAKSRIWIAYGSAALIAWILIGWSGTIWACAAAMVASTLCGKYFRIRLGGITGDCIGATIMLSEIAGYLWLIVMS